MLKLRRNIEKGEMTDDEASRIVGQTLFNRFVKPHLPDTPAVERKLTYEEYYKQFEQCPSDSLTAESPPDQ
jgi:hypothetical protein